MGVGGSVRGQRLAGNDRLQALERVLGGQLRKNVHGRLPVAPAFPPHQGVGTHPAFRQPGLHYLPGGGAELPGRRMADIPHHVAGLGQRIGRARWRGWRGRCRRRRGTRHCRGRLAGARKHRRRLARHGFGRGRDDRGRSDRGRSHRRRDDRRRSDRGRSHWHRLKGARLVWGRERRTGGRRRRLKWGGGRPRSPFRMGQVAKWADRRGPRRNGCRANWRSHLGRRHRPTPGPACSPRCLLFLGTAAGALGGDLCLRPAIGADPLPAGLKLLDVQFVSVGTEEADAHHTTQKALGPAQGRHRPSDNRLTPP